MKIHDATETAYRNGYAKGREDALAADVVEVVRCKDCRHCEHFYPEKQIGKEAREAYYCAIGKLTVSANHFCSYGERREKNDD